MNDDELGDILLEAGELWNKFEQTRPKRFAIEARIKHLDRQSVSDAMGRAYANKPFGEPIWDAIAKDSRSSINEGIQDLVTEYHKQCEDGTLKSRTAALHRMRWSSSHPERAQRYRDCTDEQILEMAIRSGKDQARKLKMRYWPGTEEMALRPEKDWADIPEKWRFSAHKALAASVQKVDATVVRERSYPEHVAASLPKLPEPPKQPVGKNFPADDIPF